MTTSLATQATELLLASIYYERSTERSPHSFFYNRPGQHPFVGEMGIELNYDDRAMTSTVLFLRRHGAPYLRALSASEVRSTLTKFLTENFWTISNETWGGRSAGSFASFLSAEAKAALAGALRASDLFVQPRLLTLFPLSVVRCDEALIFDDFFLIPPSALTPELLRSPVRSEDLTPTSFPPFVRSGMRSHPVASWLGIWSPNFETAKRMRATVLGAVALLPHPLERYLFSGRTLTAGRCTLRGGTFTESLGEPHTPALSEDIVLTADDRRWLEILANKITAPGKANKRQMRSLEYQYRSWMPDASRRFGSLFGALDAI